MLEALTVLAPMFVIFAIGFIGGYSSKFQQGAKGLNDFVFSIALPCFIYISIATTDLPGSFPWQVWIVALLFPGIFAVAVYYVTRWLSTTHRRLAAPLSLSASYGNVGYFGIPMTIALLGTQAAVPAAIIHLLHNLVFLVGYPVLCGDTANSAQVARGSAVQRIGQEILSRAILNPVTISTILGIVVVGFNIPVPELVTDSLELLAATRDSTGSIFGRYRNASGIGQHTLWRFVAWHGVIWYRA